MFSVIDFFADVMPKNLSGTNELNRQKYISRKSGKLYIKSLKVLLVLGEQSRGRVIFKTSSCSHHLLATLISFICTIVVIPIEDQLYQAQTDDGGSIYGNRNW